jgi:hypothetical protein
LSPNTLEDFKEARSVKELLFLGNIHISKLEKTEIKAKTDYSNLIIWTDRFRLDSGHLGAGIAWRKATKWNQKSLGIGYSKEILDAELIGILKVLKIAIKERKMKNYDLLIIFLDSQATIQRTLNNKIGPGQALAIKIIIMTEKLQDKGI